MTSKSDILNYKWIKNSQNNNVIIKKITEKNLCSESAAASYLLEYHKFMFCLSNEFKNSSQDKQQMPLFPSSIVKKLNFYFSPKKKKNTDKSNLEIALAFYLRLSYLL